MTSEENEQSAKMNLAKEKDFSYNVRKYLREYNEVTGIHGLRYLTEKRSIVEKIVWAIILLISLGGCIFMIYEIVMKYENSPVVVSFASRETPIYEIPFPAVTICPVAKCARIKFNFTDTYIRHVELDQELDENELQVLLYMSQLCDSSDNQKIINESSRTVDAENFFDIVNMIKPEPIMVCVFMKQINTFDENHLQCSEIFTPVMTDEGICYSFNLMDRSEMFRDHVSHFENFHNVGTTSQNFDVESGYAKSAGVETYPRRALKSGKDNSLLIFAFTSKLDNDYLCNEFMQGFEISIHNPLDVPRLAKHSLSVPSDKVVQVAVQPELITTSEAVKKFGPEKRNCYFTSERFLKHFKWYTQSNCLLECLTNYTLSKCECVNFFMPRNNRTAICGAGSTECLSEAENEFNKEELENKISGNTESAGTSCDCKPLCTELKYNTEVSQSDFFWKDYFAVQHKEILQMKKVNINNMSCSVVSVYFKAEQFMTSERNELYGVSDLISNFGGLLGLFTGFSLISLVEIIYFLTLRIFYNERLYGLWSGPPN